MVGLRLDDCLAIIPHSKAVCRATIGLNVGSSTLMSSKRDVITHLEFKVLADVAT